VEGFRQPVFLRHVCLPGENGCNFFCYYHDLFGLGMEINVKKPVTVSGKQAGEDTRQRCFLYFLQLPCKYNSFQPDKSNLFGN
ncbi:MAG: hypothetical protein ACO1NZ_02925, partial [Adhaeribacter sp.]